MQKAEALMHFRLELDHFNDLLPTESEEREVLGVRSILVERFPSCQDMETIIMQRHEYSWVVKIRNTSEAVLRPQYTLGHYADRGPMCIGQYSSLGPSSSVFLIISIYAYCIDSP